jgi:hypothetical protein
VLTSFGQRDNLILFVDEALNRAVSVSTTSFDVSPAAPLSSFTTGQTWSPITVSLSPVYAELASSAFITNAPPTQTNRTYRVPKAVLAELQANLPDAEADPALLASARTLLTGTINTESLKALQPNFKSLPSPAATSWVSRIIQSLVATGELAAPPEPHAYEIDLDNPDLCKVCGLPIEDLLHTAPGEDAEGSNKFFALFNAEDRVDALFAQDSAGAWWMRDLGAWAPAEALENVHNLVPLDTDSVLSLRAQVDDASNLPGTYELSISEERLAQLALPEMDLDLYARVFATMPYVSPEVRSKNASAQSRDSDGKFIKMGARLTTPSGEKARVTNLNPGEDTVTVTTESGQEEQVTAAEVKVEDSEPKATLPVLAAPVEDPVALLDEYLGANGTPAPEDKPVVADAGGTALVPTDIQNLPVTDSSTSTGGADATEDALAPLYLAVVDEEDLQAVIELLAIIPDEAGTGLECFRRDDAAWVPASEFLQDLQGTTPPPVVELDTAVLEDVIGQIDSKAMQASAAPQTAEVVCYTLSRGADGNLTAVQGTTPILASYSDVGEFPLDVYETLEALFADAPAHSAGEARLKKYWLTGEGGTEKIRWGNPDNGDFTRCVRHLKKYITAPGSAEGFCAKLHHTFHGYWPGDSRNLD